MAPHPEPEVGPARDGVRDPVPESGAGKAFEEAVRIMARLRGPGGCPWDREQTPSSIRKYTLEETYEVLDAIERNDPADLCDELGDLLLQVLFYAEMSAEAGQFDISNIIEGLNRKLVRRHPHVFGAAAAAAAGNQALLDRADASIESSQVLLNWNQIKASERKQKVVAEGMQDRLSGILRSHPALLEAGKLGTAAAKAGFDWPDPAGLLDKMREEIAEVEAELQPGEPPSDALRAEIGDLLFVTANLARHLRIEPEMALRDANAKFRRRFAAMEAQACVDGGLPLEQRSLDALEELWQAAKRGEIGDRQ